MSKRRIKLIIWAVLLLIIATALWGAIRGAANLLAYFERGANPASALNIVPNIPADLHIDLAWQPDDADTGRTVDPFIRTQIESTYVRGWLQWNFSYMKSQPYGLKTYFVGPALRDISDAVDQASAAGLHIEQADTVHRLQLHFYSADGSVASFTDHGAVVAQVIRDETGKVLFAGETRADYDVIMMLDDGNWQIRHWVRREATVDRSNVVVTPCERCITIGQGSNQAHLMLEGQPFTMVGINYYPQATPWDTFWPKYNPAIIDRDFSRIKGLGLNTVRIFVPYGQFGGPNVQPAMLAQLRDLLDRAQAQNLHVIVTLFDFPASFDLLHWADGDRQLETLLTTFRSHPAILAWDLKNEPDSDYARADRETVNAWLEHIAKQARRFDANHLLTIGWSNPETAQQLVADIDIVQFQYYGLTRDLQARYAALRAIASGKPIILGEFGMPTWNSVFPDSHSEAEQAAYYADMLTELRQTDNAGYLTWTLYDFDSVPATVAGRWPWQTGPQRHMGILRADESAKPAAALIAPHASLQVPPVPAWARFLKTFWLLMGGLTLGSGAFVAWRMRCWVASRPHEPITTANSRSQVPLARTNRKTKAKQSKKHRKRTSRLRASRPTSRR